MKGYPKYFATKEDYKNIVRDFPEWKEQVKTELAALKNIRDTKVLKATTLIDPSKHELGWKTQEINDPYSRYMQKGFKTKKELEDMVAGIYEIGEGEIK